ncbi:hypothetical protein DM01DRAFT_1387382, partial [Hesseltinella vesiculosa]
MMCVPAMISQVPMLLSALYCVILNLPMTAVLPPTKTDVLVPTPTRPPTAVQVYPAVSHPQPALFVAGDVSSVDALLPWLLAVCFIQLLPLMLRSVYHVPALASGLCSHLATVWSHTTYLLQFLAFLAQFLCSIMVRQLMADIFLVIDTVAMTLSSVVAALSQRFCCLLVRCIRWLAVKAIDILCCLLGWLAVKAIDILCCLLGWLAMKAKDLFFWLVAHLISIAAIAWKGHLQVASLIWDPLLNACYEKRAAWLVPKPLPTPTSTMLADIGPLFYPPAATPIAEPMAPPQSWNSYLHEHGIIATPPTIDYWKLCIAGGDGCNDAFVFADAAYRERKAHDAECKRYASELARRQRINDVFKETFAPPAQRQPIDIDALRVYYGLPPYPPPADPPDEPVTESVPHNAPIPF